MQLEGLVRSGDSGSLAARVAAALGFYVQGADPGAAPGPDPSPNAQLALQLAWQGHAPPYDAMQLDPPPGEPAGSFHVLAAAALGEAAGGAAISGASPHGAQPSPGGEPVEGTPRKGPGAGRKAKGTSSSQYRCRSHYFQPVLGRHEPHDLISLARLCAHVPAQHDPGYCASRVSLLTGLCAYQGRDAAHDHRPLRGAPVSHVLPPALFLSCLMSKDLFAAHISIVGRTLSRLLSCDLPCMFGLVKCYAII